MPDTPSQDADQPVEVEIKSNGSAIRSEVQIIAVRTRAEVNRVPEAVIVIQDGDVATSEFPIADSKDFIPGADIEIRASYGSARSATIFKGVVTATRLRIDSDQGPRLEITCRNKAYVLLNGARTAIFKDQTDSNIIAKVIGDAGLNSKVASTKFKHPEFIQMKTTDWDFIVARAAANGLNVTALDDTLAVVEPEFSAAPKLVVTFGMDLISFDAEMSSRLQFAEYSQARWDPKDQAMAQSTAKAQSNNKWGDLSAKKLAEAAKDRTQTTHGSAPMDTTYMETAMKGHATRADLAALQGVVTFQGNAQPELNGTLELAGLGDRFSGTGIICGVMHRIAAGQWTTQTQLGLTLSPDETHNGGPRHGLMIGKVVKLDEDPESLYRIAVKLPEIDGGETPVWARLGLDYATTEAGMMFLPEIDDEVVIGFLDDAPVSPVILGSLHNPKSAQPKNFTPAQENNTKVIVTRSQLKVIFDEDKKVLTLETPGGNTAVLDDDAKSVTLTDLNGNTVELGTSGITLESKSDVTIKASGNIDLKAGSNVTLGGGQIEASADMGFKASGGASAEVTSGGTMTVKGSLVQIN